MSKKTQKTRYDKVSTLLADDITFKDGTLYAKSTVRIDGKFLGQVDINGSFVVGKNGRVEGNIKCQNILVSGNILGNVKAKGQIHITSSGILDGDIVCDKIIIDEGAVFTGKCSTKATDGYKQSYSNDIAKGEDVFKKQTS